MSLKKILEDKVNAHDGLVGIKHIKLWLRELEAVGIYHQEDTAKRKLRDLRLEGKIDSVIINKLAYYKRKSKTITFSCPFGNIQVKEEPKEQEALFLFDPPTPYEQYTHQN